jgi:hypothetical protein
MQRPVRMCASIGAQTDREQVIGITDSYRYLKWVCADLNSATCAIDHVTRVAHLHPGYYEPNYHVYVYEDIKELFFITLTTNRKDVGGIDSRAVGMSDFETPFTPAEARKILSQTTFTSEHNGIWNVEVQSSTHTGTLVEATTGNEDENLDDRDSLPSTESFTEMEDEEGHCTSLIDDKQERNSKAMEDELEKEYRIIESVKQDLAADERIQLRRMIEVIELKRQLACKMAKLREVETVILPLKRNASKNMDKEYYAKLKGHEDSKVAGRKQVAFDDVDAIPKRASDD